ncbi:hypothetical protein [Catenuloplanes indicus]|uniref:Secreted protein n=1 Tax=Catenuloplanes indicus TaxID=137267 RepID=A0AAE4B1Q5_9ACTN|nr:hypothetical protein [Catenuloplanes indicus]MDQ0368133.1 hypothetical protein [Catenuloplanes indicus]
MRAGLGAVLAVLLSLVSLPVPAAASPAEAAAVAAATKKPLSYRVFATREGLVGGVTANGHVIVERDHFVALPSRLGLSSFGGGERSVRVCAGNGRCAYAPVWDVGPWNTTDDYWNAPRQTWAGLQRGRPQAQAAYETGYNGGRDQFARDVLNPAGIDLADGTFWDALRLTDNAWVSVDFLWTGGGRQGTVVTGGGPVRLRAGASGTSAEVGMAGERAQLPIQCQKRGQKVAGTVRTTNLWDRVAPGTYVSHAYVSVPSGFSVRRC